MSAEIHFKVADRAATVSAWIFRSVTLISAGLLFFPTTLVESWLNPFLVVGAFAGVTCSFVINIYQTHGNKLLRHSQLANALDSSVREPIRDDYYNSPLGPSIPRLASTTLENTLFTLTVLAEMLKKERMAVALYLAIFLFLLAFRATSLNWVVFLASIVFSGDVILSWLRMERFRWRTSQVHEALRQAFLQGNLKRPNSTALILAAFADYECAKDEAALPLNSSVFKRLNASTSAKWEEMKNHLGIK